MPVLFGYFKFQKFLKDLGKRDNLEEKLPYGFIQRFAWKGTLGAAADLDTDDEGNLLLSRRYVAAGDQLKLLFLRVWTQVEGGSKFIIRQTGGTAHGLPSGTIDVPMLEAAGAEVLGPQPLISPIHVLEGSVDILLQHAVPTAGEIGVAWWGVEE